MNTFQRGVKRTFDFTAALVGLLVLLPVFILVYIMQKIEGKGPAIFSQERIGKGGKPFRLYKFRTMLVNSEETEPELVQNDDVRISRQGRFLREHHIDELPQLWNVLIGNMSIVGYRPERQYYIDKILKHNPDYVLLYCSRPGITSDAALRNGYTDTMEKMLRRLELDLAYLRHRSIWLDGKIILATLFMLVRGKKDMT